MYKHHNGPKMMPLCILCAAVLSTFTLLALPASARWRDITAEIESILGAKSNYSPVYLQEGSIKNIKSVNFMNTTYRRAVFSYSLAGSTTRAKYLFDCEEANYKTSDTESGFWIDLNWITPPTDRSGFEWAAYRYLCPNSKDPWVPIAENSDGEQYYININTGYSFKIPSLGNVRTWVMTRHKDSSSGNGLAPRFTTYLPYGYNLLKLCVSCKTKTLAIYGLASIPSNNKVSLSDANPDSVGEQMISVICGTKD